MFHVKPTKYQQWQTRAEKRRRQFERGSKLDRITAEAVFELMVYQERKLKAELEHRAGQPTEDEEGFILAVDNFRNALQGALYGH